MTRVAFSMSTSFVPVALLVTASSAVRVMQEPNMEALERVPPVLAKALHTMAGELDGLAQQWSSDLQSRRDDLLAPTLDELAAVQMSQDGGSLADSDALLLLARRLTASAETVERWSTSERAQGAAKLSEARARRTVAETEIQRLQHALATVRQQNADNATASLAKIAELEAEQALLRQALSPRPMLATAKHPPTAPPSGQQQQQQQQQQQRQHQIEANSASLSAEINNLEKEVAANQAALDKAVGRPSAVASAVVGQAATAAGQSSVAAPEPAAIAPKAVGTATKLAKTPKAEPADLGTKLRGGSAAAGVTSNASARDGRSAAVLATANATTQTRSVVAATESASAIRDRKVGMSKNLFYFLHPEIIPPLPAAVVSVTSTSPPGPALSHLLAAEAIMDKVLDESGS